MRFRMWSWGNGDGQGIQGVGDDDGAQAQPEAVPFASFMQPPTAQQQTSTQQEPEEVLTDKQQDHHKARKMLRTLSSAMNKPYWKHCTETEDPCVMPNIKHTPDISVVI